MIMHLRKFFSCSVYCIINLSSTDLFQSLGEFSAVPRAFFSKYLLQLGLLGDPWLPSPSAYNTYLGRENMCLALELQTFYDVFCCRFCLCCNPWSCSYLFCMMLRAGSAGNNMNSAVTWYDVIHFPGLKVTFLMDSIKFCVLCMWCCDMPTSGWRMQDNCFAVQ